MVVDEVFAGVFGVGVVGGVEGGSGAADGGVRGASALFLVADFGSAEVGKVSGVVAGRVQGESREQHVDLVAVG